MPPLSILFTFRAPLGGLFRQVLDLVNYHSAQGHRVGIVCDSLTGGDRATEVLKGIEAKCVLGIHRMPMHRNPHPSDITNIRAIARIARENTIDVIHGHGSKGGLYARFDAISGLHGPVRAYTPHGGSFNYKPGSALHRAYMLVEKLLERGTDVFTFESQYIADCFMREVGRTDKLVHVTLNGLYPHEFSPRVLGPDPTDLVFMGELRAAKGIDLLIEALGRLRKDGCIPTITIVGSGPDEAMLKDMTVAHGIAGQVTFPGPMRGPEGLKRGRVMVVPSRLESLPYIVLEAVAAEVPLVTTDCGGINEIVGKDYAWMYPANCVNSLVTGIRAAMNASPEHLAAQASRLRDRARPVFDVDKMGADIIAAYRAAIDRRSGALRKVA